MGGNGGNGPATVAQVNAVLAAIDADGGGAGLRVDDILVTYVSPVVATALGRPNPWGFFVQAAPEGPALNVDLFDAGVAVGDRVSFTVSSTGRFFNQRQVTSISNLVRSSMNNSLAGYSQDISNVDFSVPSNLDLWESRLVHLNAATPHWRVITAGNGFSSISVTTGAMTVPSLALQFRMPTAVLDSLELNSSCRLTTSGVPLIRFSATAQPTVFFANELTTTPCPPPNLVSAVSVGATDVLATFDRALAAGTVTAQAFSIDAGATLGGPTIVSSTVAGPRTVTLQTSALTNRPYELSVSTAVTDLSGRPVLQRTRGFLGATPPAGCSPVVISQVYAGGGEPSGGSTYNIDFIELRNRSSSPVSVGGWSLQSQFPGGNTWAVLAVLSGELAPNSFALVTTGTPDGGGAPLTGDFLGGFQLAMTGGKVALVPSLAPLPAPCPATGVADLISYGPNSVVCAEGLSAPALSLTTSLTRQLAGCTDTGANQSDFQVSSTVTPRRKSSGAFNACSVCN